MKANGSAVLALDVGQQFENAELEWACAKGHINLYAHRYLRRPCALLVNCANERCKMPMLVPVPR